MKHSLFKIIIACNTILLITIAQAYHLPESGTPWLVIIKNNSADTVLFAQATEENFSANYPQKIRAYHDAATALIPKSMDAHKLTLSYGFAHGGICEYKLNLTSTPTPQAIISSNPWGGDLKCRATQNGYTIELELISLFDGP